MKLDGSVAIVTGASGGIGEATARHFSGQGARVVLVARSVERLRAVSSELPGSWVRPCDLSRTLDAAAMIADVLDRFGRVDVLVNNAGRGYDATVEALRLDRLRDIIELDLLGPVAAMQAVIPAMRAAGRGSIVNVSSGTALMHLPGMGGYAAVKAALAQVSLTAREELAPDGIGVTVVYPFITATAFEANTLHDPERVPSGPEPDRGPPADPPEFVARLIADAVVDNPAEVVAHPWMRPDAGTGPGTGPRR